MDSKIHRLGKSLYVIVGPEGATNFTIVKADDGSAVLIDADIRRIDEINEALKLTGCAVRYLVNTHKHFDHTSANHYFEKQGIAIVSSEACVRAMQENGEKDFTRLTAPLPELYRRFPELRMTLPQVVFRDTTRLTLPGVTLHLKYSAQNGHSHSKGDITLFLEEEEILVAGDLLYTEVHPVTFYADIPNWLGSLKPLLESDFKQLVPGHGPAVDGQQAGKAYLKKLYNYLEDFYGHLLQVRSGRERAEELAAYMTRGSYASLGKIRMVKRNIDQFLTGKWY